MTKAELREYIKIELGYPLINVELTDSQIDHAIDKSVQIFTNIAYDGELVRYITMKCEGRGIYNVNPNVEEILQVCKTSNYNVGMDMGPFVDTMLSQWIFSNVSGNAVGYLVQMSATRSLFKKYFGDSIGWEFNSLKSELYITENFHGSLLIEARTRYIPDKDDKIFDQEWVKRMSVEQARLQQSTNVGKYTQNLVGGAQINFSDIRSLAQENINTLMDELNAKWQEPGPVSIW